MKKPHGIASNTPVVFSLFLFCFHYITHSLWLRVSYVVFMHKTINHRLSCLITKDTKEICCRSLSRCLTSSQPQREIRIKDSLEEENV